MKRPAAPINRDLRKTVGINSSFRKARRAYSNLDSRFSTLHSKAIAEDGRGDDYNAPRGGVFNPAFRNKKPRPKGGAYSIKEVAR
jgi:hypothetical protein